MLLTPQADERLRSAISRPYGVLRDARPYHDPEADYEALMVRRNAPRWVRMLHRYGLIEHAPA